MDDIARLSMWCLFINYGNSMKQILLSSSVQKWERQLPEQLSNIAFVAIFDSETPDTFLNTT